jgi:ethanolamine utilization protein EutQ
LKEFKIFRRKDANLGSHELTKPINVLDRYVNETNSDQLGGGLFRMHDVSVESTLPYDEICICLEGKPRLKIGDQTIDLDIGDVAWLPKGTTVTFGGENAVMFYAVYPVDWRSRQGAPV